MGNGAAIQKVSHIRTEDNAFFRRQTEGKLFRAIAARKFKLARILVEGGVNVNCTLRTGVTPLMMACDQRVDGILNRRKLDLVKVLIKNKADALAKDNLGRTPIMYAYMNGEHPVVHALLTNNPNAWIDNNVRRVRTDSIIMQSNTCMHFQRWMTDDFAENIRS